MHPLNSQCGSIYSDTESNDSSLTRSPSSLALLTPSQDVRQLQNQSGHPSLTEIKDKTETSVENKEMSFNDIMNNQKELEYFKVSFDAVFVYFTSLLLFTDLSQ